MAICRTTLFFEQLGRGWTETYWRDAGTSGLDTAASDALAAKRIKCSGAQTFLRYARVSAEGVFRDAALRTYGGGGLQGLTTEKSDAPTVALLTRCRNVPFTGLKFIFMRGIWDSICIDGGKFVPTPAFSGYFNDFAAQLAAGGWGWLGKTTSVTKLVTTVTQEAGGTVTVTTDGPLFAGPFPMDTIVRISGVNGAWQINGTQIVRANFATQFTTRNRIAIFPYQLAGKVQWNTNGLILITQATPDRIVERKVGNVSFVSRGRRRAVVRR